jgi:uncharacterized damage-inducible protein DinB
VSAQGRTLALLLVREIDGFERELALWPDDERVWHTAPGVANSAANLALHVAGNLQYFVGSVLGGTGYVRNREDEFGRRAGTRAAIVGELHAARRVVEQVLPGLTDEGMTMSFPNAPGGFQLRTDRFLMHLAVHAAYHLGQASYLRRVVLGDARTSGAIPLDVLV